MKNVIYKVLLEVGVLKVKVNNLEKYLDALDTNTLPTHLTPPSGVQHELLKKQLIFMKQYLAVLEERKTNFRVDNPQQYGAAMELIEDELQLEMLGAFDADEQKLQAAIGFVEQQKREVEENELPFIDDTNDEEENS